MLASAAVLLSAPEMLALGAAEFIGLLIPLAVVASFTLPPILALGNDRPRMERVGIVTNKIALFLLAASALALLMREMGLAPLGRLAIPGILLATCTVLNVLALKRQRASRVAPNNSSKPTPLRGAA